ncbi:hypothetical protein [Pseudochryseolinea flava]|nr:hypothetical protein [Pseudochryseolinea flava]
MKNLLLLLALVCTCFFQACNEYSTNLSTKAILSDKQDIENAIKGLRSLADRIDDARSVIGAANP